MQSSLTTVLLALLPFTLTFAAPTSRLAPPTAFSASHIATTLPATSICGQPGLVPSTLLTTHPALTLSTHKGLHAAPTCASHCLLRTGCASFAYNQVNGSCALYTESVADMGFRRDAGAVFWWDRACFERHGDWMGVEDERESFDGGRNGRSGRWSDGSRTDVDVDVDAAAPVRDVFRSADVLSKTDTEIIDEAEDALLAAPYMVRRPSEVQFARDRAAARIAAEKSRMAGTEQALVAKGRTQVEQKKLSKRSSRDDGEGEHRLASRRRPAFGDVAFDVGF